MCRGVHQLSAKMRIEVCLGPAVMYQDLGKGMSRAAVSARSDHRCISGKVCAKVCAGVCTKYAQILWVCSRACATLWSAVCARSDRRMQTWPGMRQGMRRGVHDVWLNCALKYARMP